MATKVSLDHVQMVLQSTNHYKLIDIFNVLSKIAIQIDNKTEKTSQFLIRTDVNSIYNLSLLILKEAPYMNSRNTVTDCLNALIDMKILQFNYEEYSWEITNMDRMFHNSINGDKKVGYMNLRSFFFTKEFYNLPVSDKKIIYYACSIMDSKGFKHYQKLVANLKYQKNDDISAWLKFLNTKDVYYSKKVLLRVLSKYNLFEDVSEEARKKSLSDPKYKNVNFNKLKLIDKSLKFKFWFKPLEKLKNIIGRTKDKALELENLIEKYNDFYEYIKDTTFSFGEKVASRMNNELYYAMLTVGRSLSWNIKRLLVRNLCIRLFDNEPISAPEKYISRIAYGCLKSTI